MSLPLLALPLTVPESEPPEADVVEVEHTQRFEYPDCDPFYGIATYTPAYVDRSERVLKKQRMRYPGVEPRGRAVPARFSVVMKQRLDASDTLFTLRRNDELPHMAATRDDPEPTSQPVILFVTGEYWQKSDNCKNSMKKIIPAAMTMLRKLYPNVEQVIYDDQAIIAYDFDDDEGASIARMQTFTTVAEFERELERLIYRIRYYINLGFEFYQPRITMADYERVRGEAAKQLLGWLEEGEVTWDDVRRVIVWRQEPKFTGDLVEIARNLSAS